MQLTVYIYMSNLNVTRRKCISVGWLKYVKIICCYYSILLFLKDRENTYFEFGGRVSSNKGEKYQEISISISLDTKKRHFEAGSWKVHWCVTCKTWQLFICWSNIAACQLEIVHESWQVGRKNYHARPSKHPRFSVLLLIIPKHNEPLLFIPREFSLA